jgi:hypothetical protein
VKKCNFNAGSMTSSTIGSNRAVQPGRSSATKLGVFGRSRENSTSREHPPTVTIPVACCFISSVVRFVRMCSCQSCVLLDYSYRRNLMSFSCSARNLIVNKHLVCTSKPRISLLKFKQSIVPEMKQTVKKVLGPWVVRVCFLESECSSLRHRIR